MAPVGQSVMQAVHEPQALPDQFAAFGISGSVRRLLSSHPPLEQRIAALQAGR